MVLSRKKQNIDNKHRVFDQPLDLAKTSEKILVLSVDRDDDVGKLLSISGPIVGIDANLKVATNLAIADPEESDANCIFAAIKKYYILKDKFDIEIATLTGHSKENMFLSDKIINEQLKEVLEVFPASSVVFITDGAEDDQVMPLIQNYVPIMSKETVIIKQAHQIESTFYTIKKALKDPFFARVVFGVPAIVLLLLVFAGKYALSVIALLFGIYFLIKGFNLEHKLNDFLKIFTNKFSIQRVSFPFYLAFFFLLILAIVTGIKLYIGNFEFNIGYRFIYVIRAILLYLVLSIISFVSGAIIDLFYLKEGYRLGAQIFTIISTLVIAEIIDFAFQLLLGDIKLIIFVYIVVTSVVFLYVVNKALNVFDITRDITDQLVGLPVISKYGLLAGIVVAIDAKENSIKYKSRLSKGIKTVSKSHFTVVDGQIVI